MRVRKKSTQWDVDALPAKLIAEFEDWEDQPDLKNKKGHPCPAIRMTFRIIDETEEFVGNVIDKLLWYNMNDDGEREMGAKAFQVIEAVNGGTEQEDGDKSPNLDKLIGNQVLLTIIESTRNAGYPEINKVEPYNEDEDEDEKPKRKAKGKTKEKSKSSAKAKPKSKPKPEPEEDEDEDEDDGEEPKPKKGKAKKGKAKPKSESEDEDDDDFGEDFDEDDEDDDED